MIRVRTGSRLHFGLLRAAAAGDDEPRYGGAGLMIEEPAVEVSVQSAAKWSAIGPQAPRALLVSQRIAHYVTGDHSRAFSVCVHRAAPEHCGFGSGTQLALAAAHATAAALTHTEANSLALARIAGRGQRSSIGIHGFSHGGFLMDGGKAAESHDIGQLVAAFPFPASWRMVVVVPAACTPMHGSLERQAFARLCRDEQDRSAYERRRLLLEREMPPALARQDWSCFSEALHEYNRLSGEQFASVQGGPYASPEVEELVGFIRRLGCPGVGQSSWGPAVFAIAQDADQSANVAHAVRQKYKLAADSIMITSAKNSAAALTRID
jgi:beta-RFAP synthase